MRQATCILLHVWKLLSVYVPIPHPSAPLEPPPPPPPPPHTHHLIFFIMECWIIMFSCMLMQCLWFIPRYGVSLNSGSLPCENPAQLTTAGYYHSVTVDTVSFRSEEIYWTIFVLMCCTGKSLLCDRVLKWIHQSLSSCLFHWIWTTVIQAPAVHLGWTR